MNQEVNFFPVKWLTKYHDFNDSFNEKEHLSWLYTVSFCLHPG